MTARRLFHSPLEPGRSTLSGDESHHAASVLRCQRGNAVLLFDGDGREAGAVIVAIARSGVTVDVGEITERPPTGRVRLTLATALPRRQRQPFLFEKCTELGVWAIWPTLYERSVVKPEPDQVEKWRRTTIEAAKQCGRCRLPVIEAPMPLSAVIARAAEFDRLIVTRRDTSCPSLSAAMNDKPIAELGATRTLVLIGPEGGMTDDELATAAAAGAVSATLGENTLRIETAALAACALTHL